MGRRWLGVGGRCTCHLNRGRNGDGGPCGACEAQIEQEEFVREFPEEDPGYEEGIERAEREYEGWLDSLMGY